MSVTLRLFAIHTDQICDIVLFFQNTLVDHIGVCTDTNNIFTRWTAGDGNHRSTVEKYFDIFQGFASQDIFVTNEPILCVLVF